VQLYKPDRFLATRDGQDYILYQESRKEARRETRRAVREYEHRIALDARRNPKRFWAYTKRKCKKKDKIPDLKDGDI
jgi:hypothetical protein